MADKVKVTKIELVGLRFLSKSWAAIFFERKPLRGWPKKLGARTFDSLLRKKLIRTSKMSRVKDKWTTRLTPAGRALLSSGKTGE